MMKLPTLSTSGGQDISLLASLLKRLPLLGLPQNIQLQPASTNTADVKLARLPVPSLEATMATYLKSVKPLVTPEEFKKTRKLVDDLTAANGEGRKLQALLEERAMREENWLTPWWLNTAYLECRNPVVVFSSPGMVWPQVNFRNKNEQLVYAAHVIRAALEYNKILERRGAPQEMMDSSPVDMGQFYQIIGTTRIPKAGRDTLSYQNPTLPSRSIIVMHNNHIYSLRVYQQDDLTPLDVSQIYGQLLELVANSTSRGDAVGVLTSDHRDAWAANYETLTRDPDNLKHLLEIEEALFIVCLDQPMETKTVSGQTRTGQLVLHGGGGSAGNGGNRWFDKTVQFIIGADSDGVGITNEHTLAEGGVFGVLTDFIVDRVHSLPLTLEASPSFPKPNILRFNIDDAIKSGIKSAASKLDKLANDLEIQGFSFSEFGKNSLKELKVSPDSFIQVAIQYAFYRVHKQPGAQYESGSLRKFIHGRTDVIRTCSEEVLAFCALDPQTKPEGRAQALRTAIDLHQQYAHAVHDMKGVDRHLLGLKILAKTNNLPVPELFSDAGYVNSTNFRLSTSNVPAKCNGFMVYRPIVADGYACCYNPRPDSINFGTSAWVSNPITHLSEFRRQLESSLVDMRDLLLGQTRRSKL